MFLTRGLTVRFFTDDGNVMAEGQPDHHHAGVFLSDVLLRGGLVLRQRGCGRCVMPTVLTLFGTCLLRLALLFFVTFPHLEQLDHCAVLSRNVADHSPCCS